MKHPSLPSLERPCLRSRFYCTLYLQSSAAVCEPNHPYSSLVSTMHFPSQLKSWLGKRRRPKAKKGNRGLFESYYRSLFHSSDHEAHVISEGKEVDMTVKHAWMLTLDDFITRHDLRRIHGNKPPLIGYVGGLSASRSTTGSRHTLRDHHYRNILQSCDKHLIHESLSSEE